jgi:hypothetical protein
MLERNAGARGARAWRPDVAMTAEERDEFLSGRWLCRLATNGSDGFPHVTPVWYYWDGGCLYVGLGKTRQSCRNLERDPRCSAVIDMDDRPLMGMRTNLAKAVAIKGEAVLMAEMDVIGPDHQAVWFASGPFATEMSLPRAFRVQFSRYGLWARDGALGLTHDGVHVARGDDEAALHKQAAGRVFVKIRPMSIRAWDFSKVPYRFDAKGE